MSEILERKDVPPESKWNSKAVFDSWAEWNAEAEAVTADIPQLLTYKGRLADEPTILADFLEALMKADRRIMRLMVYVNMAVVVDANDIEAKKYMGQWVGIYAKLNAATAFGEPEMLAIGGKLKDWAKEEPRLTIYNHYFNNVLRQKAHRRSTEVEEILGMLEEPFDGASQTAHELTNLEMKFNDALDSGGQSHPVAHAMIPPVGIQSPDRAHRRTAWQNYYDSYLALKNTLASIYITSVKQHVFLARVRGYKSVLEMMLDPANLPVEVFHNLIDTFKANLPTWHKYWEVKRKVLAVEEIHPYDIWAPIVENQPVIPYREGVDMICEGLAPLGESYVNVLRRGCLEDGWVDYAPNTGKAQGAASGPAFDTPPFIFMSYDDSLTSMSVLAHELGHSMHGYLADHNLPHVYYSRFSTFSISAGETASNFNQALIRAYLLKSKADDEAFQLTLIDEALYNFQRYFFIMPTLARFEFEVFSRAEQDKSLTAETLNDLMADLYAEGYGDTMSDDRERTAITWAQFGHLYMPYYTFQYAIGISAAHALADKILNGSEGAVDNYLNFLKAGGSMYVTDLFKMAGVDMTKPAPVEKAFAVLADLVDRLDNLA